VTEVWLAGASAPGRAAHLARRTEEEGWDGLALVDSQNLAPDPYVNLALAAAATSRLKLATGVTNPLTRHPAVTATAIASVHAESGGRAVLGIGRGDSSLAHLGLAPASPSALEHYLVRLQGYLRGDEVPFEVAEDGAGAAPPAAALGMAGAPSSSQIRWLRSLAESGRGASKVPVDLAATGPRVIAIGARHADRITFAVGSDPVRVRWAICVVETTLTQAPGERGKVALGAYVPVVVHEDRTRARELISGGVASFARFSVMHGRVSGPVDVQQHDALEAVHERYDMHAHFTHGSPQSRDLPATLVDAFGIAGPPGYCVERLSALVEAGLDKLVLLGGGIGMDRESARRSRQMLVQQVLPKLR
jgi:5,10-methylenetetrahydromethanopterin reductase